MSIVAVIVPVYQERLLPEEKYALQHLRRHLGHYDCYQMSPKTLSFRLDGLKVKQFEDTSFQSVDSYSKLMLSAEFYRAFVDYDFILIYQLDCLVFSDQLQAWCQRGYDYLGAPLFKSSQSPELGFLGTLNGGLSLRRVSAFLRVLSSRRYLEQPASFIADVFCGKVNDFRSTKMWQRWVKRMRVAREVRHGVAAYTAGYTLNEDHFWSDRAAYFDPQFRVAPPEVALKFAFETAPAWCFEQNGRKLPFGAHAWQKYGRSFWEPHLLP
jgi:hypothetical protein